MRTLLGTEAFDFLEKEGFAVLKGLFAANEDEAAGLASQIGFPVALKISSPYALHKTEAGGVKLPLKDEEEVRQAFQDVARAFTSVNPGKGMDGVIVQRLGSGFELIVGTLVDQQFGPVLMCGLGGIFAEAMNDVSFRLIPAEERDAREMVEELKGYGALQHPRQGSIDIPSIEAFLLHVSRLMERHSEIEEMDLNPVFVSSRGMEICDARIRIN
jgi:acetate---CoA ligase (ADP-forming) subunit beta